VLPSIVCSHKPDGYRGLDEMPVCYLPTNQPNRTTSSLPSLCNPLRSRCASCPMRWASGRGIRPLHFLLPAVSEVLYMSTTRNLKARCWLNYATHLRLM
jgi:hypothetical protein